MTGVQTCALPIWVPYLIDAHNGSYASDLEDILSSAAGPQDGSLTLGTATSWFMVLATFHPTVTVSSTTSSTTTTTTATTTDPTTTTKHRQTTTTTSTTTTSTTATISCGDVNGDGVVNIGDALLTAQYDVGLRACGQGPFTHPEACDVNQDGACNVGDALRIGQCDVRLISCAFTCRPFSCP